MRPRTKKFRCWNNNANFELTLEGNTLTINMPLPYRFKWLQLIDPIGTGKRSVIYEANPCRFDLGPCPPGRYDLNLFVGNDRFSSFESYIYKQITLELDNRGQWLFVLPEFTLWNQNLVKRGLLDVSSKTYYVQQHTMIKFANKLTAKCRTIREKVLAVHDFVASQQYYDYDDYHGKAPGAQTIEQIVLERKGVCQGYSDLALVLLHSLGIRAENIRCYAIHHDENWDKSMRPSTHNHVMTRAWIGTRWLYMDVTWDSPNKYEDGKYQKGGKVSHRYFDVTIPLLSATHRFSKAASVPAAPRNQQVQKSENEWSSVGDYIRRLLSQL